MFRSFRLYIAFILVIGLSCKNNPTTSTTPTTGTPWTPTVQIPALSDFDAQFTVIGTEITIEGRIKTNSSTLFNSVLAANAGVTTVILENVPGTLDTDASFAIGRAIRSNGLASVVPAGGFIASGATDMFLAGVTRTISGPNTTKLRTYRRAFLGSRLYARQRPADIQSPPSAVSDVLQRHWHPRQLLLVRHQGCGARQLSRHDRRRNLSAWRRNHDHIQGNGLVIKQVIRRMV